MGAFNPSSYNLFDIWLKGLHPDNRFWDSVLLFIPFLATDKEV